MDIEVEGFIDPEIEAEEEVEPEIGIDIETFKGVVKTAVQDAINYAEEDLAEARVAAAEAYLAEGMDGDADLDETRSRAMSRDVHDTVHAILPSLMKIFCGTVDCVEYQPVGPEDEAFAKQATEYVNKVVLGQDNDFYTVMYSAAHDSLVKGLGVFKWWWEEDKRREGHYFSGLSPVEFNLLAGDPSVVEVDEYYEEAYLTEMGTEEVSISGHLIREVSLGGKLVIEAVPPEERLIERDARSIQDAGIYGHRRTMTVSDLVSMGFDYEQAVRLAGPDTLDTNQEAVLRLDSASAQSRESGVSADPSMSEVEVCEIYIRADLDRDGVAERYRVFTGGNAHEILEWEDGDAAIELCDDIPFAEICPDPVPHLATGKSLSAKVMDVQYVKTNLLRGVLDSLSRSIFPREEVVEGQVNIDDAMNPEIGALIRTKAPGMVREIVTPFMGKEALPVLGYYDEIKANRSGVSDATMGLDPKTLQSSTAGAVDHAVSAAQSQIELIARHFGRGVREVFRGVLRTIVKNQDRPRTVRLTGNWVEVDPRAWNAEMDAIPVTAVGHGTEREKMAQLAMIAAKQEQLLQTMGPSNGIVTIAQYRETLAEMVRLSGYYIPDKFFLPMETAQQIQQLSEQGEKAMQELEQMKQQAGMMQQELMKRSQAAASKDLAQAFASAAKGFEDIVSAVQTANQTQVDQRGAQDEMESYNVARAGFGLS